MDGRELEVSASAAPLRDGDGHIVGAVLVQRDIEQDPANGLLHYDILPMAGAVVGTLRS